MSGTQNTLYHLDIYIRGTKPLESVVQNHWNPWYKTIGIRGTIFIMF